MATGTALAFASPPAESLTGGPSAKDGAASGRNNPYPDQIEWWPLARLRMSPRNPRKHAQAQIEKLKGSLRRFGCTRPLLIRPDGEIIAGEAMLRAAREAGEPQAPVVILAGLSPAAADAYRIADNRLALDATWDDAQLAALIEEIAGLGGIEGLEGLGFDDKELIALCPEIFAGKAACRSCATRTGSRSRKSLSRSMIFSCRS